MKKNAIIIAGILAVAGASQAQQTSQNSSSTYGPAGSSLTSTESVDRDAQQAVVPPSADQSTAIQHDPAASESTLGSVSGQVNGQNYKADSDEEFRINDSQRDTDYEAEHSLHQNSDISADSSVRGGSLEARGYDHGANNNEIEPAASPLNPGRKADSSIRGGSIYARERNWNQDSEPSSGQRESHRHLKADSSIRGGSLEARGAREAMRDGNYSDFQGATRDSFSQGGAATWESDHGSGSVNGSSNWNSSDDFRDGMEAEARSNQEYERNNDASVGGAARTETGSSTLDDAELEYDSSNSPGTVRNSSDSSKNGGLNSSEQLEKNISGEFDLDPSRNDQTSSGFRLSDPNSLDSADNSLSSERSSDITHDSTGVAVGAAAAGESGSSSSSLESNSTDDDHGSFESNDPALRSSNTPLTDSDLNFIYRDNRAHGVGSLATGEFGAAASAESGRSMNDESMAREIKGKLTRESTGTLGLSGSDVARNIQVTASGGTVTLTGTVPTEKDKQMIEIRAGEMAGVKSVKNELTVTPEASPANRDSHRGHDLEDRTSDLKD